MGGGVCVGTFGIGGGVGADGLSEVGGAAGMLAGSGGGRAFGGAATTGPDLATAGPHAKRSMS